MEESASSRIALVGIIVEDPAAIEPLNQIIYDYRSAVIGRMGLPHRAKNLSIISLVLEAEPDVISALAGKLGMVPGLSVKTVYSKR